MVEDAPTESAVIADVPFPTNRPFEVKVPAEVPILSHSYRISRIYTTIRSHTYLLYEYQAG